MRLLIGSYMAFIVLFASCNENESPESEYTGKSVSYQLYAASENGVPGNVEFRERVDLSVDVIITLEGLEGEGMLPAHLHMGDLSVPDSPQAAMLSDYNVSEGRSITNLKQLADETPFQFDGIENFDGSIKVHEAHVGDGYNVIVSAGNIGLNKDLGFNLVSICSPDLLEK